MAESPQNPVAANLAEVRSRLAQAARDAGRPADSVSLVAVSKTWPAEHIRPALEAGQRVFGENRVQEAQGKWPALCDAFPGVELHLIGPLQTNKVKEAVALFDVIETLDRPRLAEALARQMATTGRRPACLIQVNTGAEPQKAGILPEEADAFIRSCRETWALPVIGLMCIPPAEEDPVPHFTLLRDIAARHGLEVLSMGMSGDYEQAVACGATHVRVGTAVFGGRDYR
ncbi:YggS family pyridoxal phosphate-dependent enzyme [Telmatospirillum sp. J64-1]|uniref:YggS family pyridoxal phosphate-dependent enzyme n=1 Tax=Telmatospirillum sp. J64-1 TaxID=2502183 RepID=UPI00115D3182|nr:YggS family pyridoxal phosphate-dependent enzyme [Telmatospirillum sp. J64-1]